MADTLYINSDNIITLTGLYDNLNDAYVNTATVTSQLTDSAGTAVGSATTLNYKAGSDGNYEGTRDDATVAAITANCYYTETTTAINGSAKWIVKKELVARYDNAN